MDTHAHAYAREQDFRSSETPSATIVTALWLVLREFLHELLHNPAPYPKMDPVTVSA